jgi:putative Mg2+ transporter-C (MgtC) family protein
MIDALLNDILTEPTLPWEVILARLVGAVVFCGMIGLEREVRARAAGLRTHMLVGLAAALYCLIMLEIIAEAGVYTDRVAMDPLRLLSSVTSGVAFLAAGMIVFSRGRVRGLTTGASLWLTAAVGVSAGLGMWLIAGMSAVLALIIIRLLKVAEEAVRQSAGQDAPPEGGP